MKSLQCRLGRPIVGNKLGKKNTKDKKLMWVKKIALVEASRIMHQHLSSPRR